MLRKLIKIVVTLCVILSIKCTQFDFGLGFFIYPAGGLYLREERGREEDERGGKGK